MTQSHRKKCANAAKNSSPPTRARMFANGLAPRNTSNAPLSQEKVSTMCLKLPPARAYFLEIAPLAVGVVWFCEKSVSLVSTFSLPRLFHLFWRAFVFSTLVFLSGFYYSLISRLHDLLAASKLHMRGFMGSQEWGKIARSSCLCQITIHSTYKEYAAHKDKLPKDWRWYLELWAKAEFHSQIRMYAHHSVQRVSLLSLFSASLIFFDMAVEKHTCLSFENLQLGIISLHSDT